MTEKLPVRIYRCSECEYSTEVRFVLKNHLRNVHGYSKRDAILTAQESEYWLNPHYIRRAELEEDEEY